jgi:Cas6b C-terminal domain/Cas6b N-terminal domain
LMILRTFILTLEPEYPLMFSVEEFRSFLNKELAEFMALHRTNTTGVVHRYPVLQVKQVKRDLIVIGISQGADCLRRIIADQMKLGAGGGTCRITARDTAIRPEPFGVMDNVTTYEFLTPWRALNQQHAKQFYDLNGKPQRDAFLQKLLRTHLTTLAKSLDYEITPPFSCEAKVRFRRDRIGNENVMVFLGKFRTNLRIPDYLGIGWQVSQGYGTIKCIMESPDIQETYERSPAGHRCPE